MSGLGVLDTHSFVEKGKMTTIQYIDFLIPINEITTVNADSGIYEIKHPDYPNCSEVMKKLRDTENSISDAKENNQVRVMLSLEIRDGKKTWKLGKYQW